MARGEIEWFLDGKLNASENCIDRHLADKANRTAIIWESDEPGDSKKISYRDLFDEVCKLANGLKSLGVKKGDRVCIYMPMIPEAAFAMLSCARIGAIHSVVFGGFSPQALEDRILDADCNFVITANEGLRGGKIIPLKQNVDKALENCPNVKSVIVAKNRKRCQLGGRPRFLVPRGHGAQMPSCPPEIMVPKIPFSYCIPLDQPANQKVFNTLLQVTFCTLQLLTNMFSIIMKATSIGAQQTLVG